MYYCVQLNFFFFHKLTKTTNLNNYKEILSYNKQKFHPYRLGYLFQS